MADRRPMWIAANALVDRATGRCSPWLRRRSVGWWRFGRRSPPTPCGACWPSLPARSSPAATFHGVLGAHLASEVTAGPLEPDLVRSAKVLHALGDTTWFIGLGALTAMTAVCAVVVVASRRSRTRWRARLGAAAVVVGVPAVRLVRRSRPRPVRRPGRPAPGACGSSRSPPRRRDYRPLPSSRRRPPDHPPWAHDARRCPSGGQVSPPVPVRCTAATGPSVEGGGCNLAATAATPRPGGFTVGDRG